MPRNWLIGVCTFVLIAFGLPWLGWFFVGDERLSLWLFPLFCSLAGFAASFAEGGRAGLGAFSRRVFAVSRAPRYVLIGIFIPLLLGLSYLLSKGVSLRDFVLSPAAVMGLTLGAALVTGPLAEEFGWRGYLQHTLLGRLAPFWGALALGGIWCAWHFPLYRTSVFASPAVALSFLSYLVTWSIFMVYLVERAGGSVWPAVAMHWAANTHVDVLRVLLPSIDGSVLPGGSKGSLYYLAAAIAFVLFNRQFFFAKHPRVPQTAVNGSLEPAPLRSSA
jgi:membrane protease YdiL (CAAX protease family)